MKALEVGPNLGEAHTAIAYALTEYFWDWEAAEAEYKEGLELSPNYATGHQWYAEYLSYMGRYDEAIKEVKIARELDPLSKIIMLMEAVIYGWSGDIETSQKYFDRNIEMYPDFGAMYINKGILHIGKEEYEDASQQFLKGLEIDKITAEGLEPYREAAKYSGFNGLIKVLHEFDLKQKPINSVLIAQNYYLLGDYENSIDWLERAIDERNLRLIRIRQGPIFSDPVFRSNPRFLAILKKMNFPDN